MVMSETATGNMAPSAGTAHGFDCTAVNKGNTLSGDADQWCGIQEQTRKLNGDVTTERRQASPSRLYVHIRTKYTLMYTSLRARTLDTETRITVLKSCKTARPMAR